jgi:hypothetical protein
MERARVDLLVAPPLTAERWPALVAALWPLAPERPICLLAPLAGDAILLGRDQCAPTVLGAAPPPLPVARRATGGRALRAGQGAFALLIVQPHSGALLPDGRPVPASKIVNRAVRPLLGALASLGVSAGYFGRDFVSVGGRPVAHVSWDARRAGPALFEAIVGVERPVLFADAYPGAPAAPAGEAPWAALAEVAPTVPRLPASDALCAALRRGFEVRLGTAPGEPQPAPEPAVPSWPGVDEELPPRASSLREVPIGRVHARVEIDELAPRRLALPEGTRVLARARLLGDFQADAESMSDLHERLRGCPATLLEVGGHIDRLFSPGSAGTLVGVRSLRPLADSILEAAAD